MAGGSRGWGARTTYAIPVRLNIYDLSPANEYLHTVGLGLYHTGVEIDGDEYTFASVGIFSHPPRAAELQNGEIKFRESLNLGNFEGGVGRIREIVDGLKREFRENQYHLIKKNCNHFSERFSHELLARQGLFPAYVNRAAWIGSFVPCFFPDDNRTGDVTPKVKERTDASFAGKGQALGETATSSRDIQGRESIVSMRENRLKYFKAA